uniref:Uncharacterized protein n=1 Tax=Oryza sativa subsp. japonica TaxID=39947 RepID=Q6K9L8_ORYSJ|nr:hypothetical protein [Oryza sativa Japonica Group]
MVGLIRIREVWLDLTAMHAEFHLPPYLLHLHLSASGSPGPTLQRHFSNDDGQGKYKKSQHRQLWAYMYTGLSLLPSQLAYGNGERNQKVCSYVAVVINAKPSAPAMFQVVIS